MNSAENSRSQVLGMVSKRRATSQIRPVNQNSAQNFPAVQNHLNHSPMVMAAQQRSPMQQNLSSFPQPQFDHAFVGP